MTRDEMLSRETQMKAYVDNEDWYNAWNVSYEKLDSNIGNNIKIA